MSRALVIVALLSACKVDKKDAKKEPIQVVGSGSEAHTVGPVEDALPEIEGATQLQVRTKSDAQQTSIWCVDTAKGRDAVVRVADALRREGWDDVTTRGAADRFGVSGKKADLHLSATVGGRDQACTGTLVIFTLARIGAAVVLPDGERPR